jgi:hypothetical protein
LEDELLMIERAKTADPETFWACVHEINAKFANEDMAAETNTEVELNVA